jgi:hypothetical protein
MSTDISNLEADLSDYNKKKCLEQYGVIMPFPELPCSARTSILLDESCMERVMDKRFVGRDRHDENLREIRKLLFWYGLIPTRVLEPLTRPYTMKHWSDMAAELRKYKKYCWQYAGPVVLATSERDDDQVLRDGYHRMYCFYVRCDRLFVPAIALTKPK